MRVGGGEAGMREGRRGTTLILMHRPCNWVFRADLGRKGSPPTTGTCWVGGQEWCGEVMSKL